MEEPKVRAKLTESNALPSWLALWLRSGSSSLVLEARSFWSALLVALNDIELGKGAAGLPRNAAAVFHR